jgi:hypothetical protein
VRALVIPHFEQNLELHKKGIDFAPLFWQARFVVAALAVFGLDSSAALLLCGLGGQYQSTHHGPSPFGLQGFSSRRRGNPSSFGQ